jgi:hypothetical protein
MKQIYFMTMIAIFSLISMVSYAADHFTEYFTAGPADYYSGLYTYSSGLEWDVANVKAETSTNSHDAWGSAVRCTPNVTSYVISPAVNTVGSITFYYREVNAVGGGTFSVQKSVDGGAFTEIASQSFAGTTYQEFTIDVNDNSNAIRIKVVANVNTFLIIDDMTVTAMSSDPELQVSPATLSGFNYIVGSGPSASQSYNLSGTFLTGYPSNIAVTAPSNYEVSLSSGSGYASSINVPYTSATLASTPIYLRLKAGLSVGTYNGETISNAGGGATTVNVTCGGSVDDLPPATLSVSPTSLSGFNYILGAGPSTEQSYNLSGSNLTGFPDNITVTAPANYEVSLSAGSGYAASISVPYASATLTSTAIYVRLKSGLSVGTYNSEIITNIGGGATTASVTCSGSVSDVPPPVLSATPTSLSGFNYILGAGPSTEQSYNLSGSNLTGFPDNITVTAPANYEVSLSAGSGYAASINVPYASATLTSTPIYVRLKSGLSVGTYNSEIITNIGGGATTINVTNDGTVSASGGSEVLLISEVADPSDVWQARFVELYNSGTSTIDFSTETWYLGVGVNGGTPSSVQLTGNVAAGATFVIAYNATDFNTQYGFAPDQNWGTVNGNGDDSYHLYKGGDHSTGTLVDIYGVIGENGTGTTWEYLDSRAVRNCASSPNAIWTAMEWTITSADVADMNPGTHCAVATPALITSTTTLTGFTYVEGSGPSTEQSFNLSGSDLTGFPDNITVTAPTNYEVSLSSGSAYAASVSVPYTSGDLSSTQIFVRLKAGLSTNTYNSELITCAGGGATSVTVACSGNVTDAPTPILSATPLTLSGFNYIFESGPSDEQTYDLSGANLIGFPDDITVTAPANYEISLSSGTGFANSLNIPYSSETLSETTIYVRLKSGLVVGTYNSEFITNSGGGATDIDITCNGSVSSIPSGACLEENFSGFTTGTHASPSTSDASSTLDTYTQTTGWEGFKIYSADGEIKLGTSSVPGYIITPTIDLSGNGTIEFDYAQWTIDNPMVQIFHASDGVNFVQLGSDITTTTDFQTHSVEITGGTALSKIKIGGTERIYLDNIIIYCGGSTPTPVLSANPTNLSGFNYIAGSGPSAEQSFDISGADLDGSNVNIVPPANYEISFLAASGYQSSGIDLSSFDGSSTTIYVRLKTGLMPGTYNAEEIQISGGGASEISITCNGTVDENVFVEVVNYGASASIYPNPTSDIFIIELNNWNCENVNCEIYDITGKLIDSYKIETTDGTARYTCDYVDINPGLYKIVISNKKDMIIKTIIKQ